jgi:hypothetical protein
MACLHNHCYNGNATVHSVCTVGLHVAVSDIKILNVAQMLSCWICISNNNKTYLGLHIKCLTLFLNFNQIWSCWTCFPKTPHIFNVIRASVQLFFICFYFSPTTALRTISSMFQLSYTVIIRVSIVDNKQLVACHRMVIVHMLQFVFLYM